MPTPAITSGWSTILEIRTKFNQHKGVYRDQSGAITSGLPVIRPEPVPTMAPIVVTPGRDFRTTSRWGAAAGMLTQRGDVLPTGLEDHGDGSEPM